MESLNKSNSAQRLIAIVTANRTDTLKKIGKLSNEEVTALRSQVLKGAFSIKSLGDHHDNWELKPFILMFFASSTFTDTQRERVSLMTKIVVNLRRRIENSGIQGVSVLPVDMRFGVRNENTLDHLTWVICHKELKRCSKLSSGIFFISLQSEKYGYTPLPKTISRESFDEHLTAVPASEDIQKLLDKWYILDSNSEPAEMVLKDLDSMDDKSFWDEALPKLTKYFDGVMFDRRFPILQIGRSVTEWEVKAAFTYESDPACSRFFWLHRQFKGGVPKTADRHWDFDDGHDDPDKEKKLVALKQWMRNSIPPERVVDFSEASFESFAREDEAWQAQFVAWETKIEESLSESVVDVIAKKEAWDKNGAGLGVPGSEAAEMLHHAKWAAIKVMDFVGREELVQRGMDAITSPAAPVEETNFRCSMATHTIKV